MVRRNDKVHYLSGSLLFLLSMTRFGRLSEIRWSVCISRPQRTLCVSFSRADSGLCVWSNFISLHNSMCCIATSIMISPIQRHMYKFKYREIHNTLTGELTVVQVRTFINFLTSEFGSSTRGESNTILKRLS